MNRAHLFVGRVIHSRWGGWKTGAASTCFPRLTTPFLVGFGLHSIEIAPHL
jgi:hypothetical protein